MSTVRDSGTPAEDRTVGHPTHDDESLFSVRTLVILALALVVGLLAGLAAGLSAGIKVGVSEGAAVGGIVGVLTGIVTGILAGLTVAKGLHALVGPPR